MLAAVGIWIGQHHREDNVFGVYIDRGFVALFVVAVAVVVPGFFVFVPKMISR